MRGAMLGNAGLRAGRLPMDGDRVGPDLAIPMIHRPFEAGANTIDTAVGTCNEDCQRAVGEAGIPRSPLSTPADGY